MGIGTYRDVGINALPREMWPSAAYAGLLTLIGRAERAIARQDVEAAHRALLQAQHIVHVLRQSLRPDPQGLSEQLRSLYEYIGHELGAANLGKDAARLAALVPVIAPLRQAWETAARTALAPASAQAGG